MLRNTMDETFSLAEAVEALTRDLDAAGESDLGRALGDAFTGSVVPGEFLGATYEQLRRLRRSPLSKRLGLRARIDTALAQLEIALKGR